MLGFERKGGAGSHVVYARVGEPLILNFKDRTVKACSSPSRPANWWP